MKAQQLLLTFFFCLTTFFLHSQVISVVHIEGTAYEMNGNDNKQSRVVFGPISKNSSIVLEDQAVVKLIKNENMFVTINKKGVYKIADLKFEEKEESSMFKKFCAYFQSFFGSHSSAESKVNYQNNIYAISRGVLPPPYLDFPLKGLLPVDKGSLEFKWTHQCDTCVYELIIYNRNDQSVAYKTETSQQMVLVSNPEKYLQADKRYFWTIKIKGVEMEYDNRSFTTAENGQFDTTISAIEKDFEADDSIPVGTARTIAVMGLLQEGDLANFALIYADLQTTDDNRPVMENIKDRMLYDLLNSMY